MSDLYKVLGVERDASIKEIKKAYKSLASIYHPDKETGDEETFKNIKKAYEVLIDPSNREYYNEHGEAKPNEVDIQKVAVSKIVVYVQAWINSGNYQVNLVDYLRNAILEEKRNVLAGYEDAKTKQSTMVKMKKKIKCTKDNFIADFFDQAINDIAKFLISSEKNQKVIIVSLELLECFDWEDEEQVFALQQYTTSTTTGGW